MTEYEELRALLFAIVSDYQRDCDGEFAPSGMGKRVVDEILRLETDTLRIAVVRKESRYPRNIHMVAYDVRQVDACAYQRKLWEEAGYVQEVTV